MGKWTEGSFFDSVMSFTWVPNIKGKIVIRPMVILSSYVWRVYISREYYYDLFGKSPPGLHYHRWAFVHNDSELCLHKAKLAAEVWIKAFRAVKSYD